MTAALWHQFGDQVPKLLYGVSENCLLKRDLSSKHITWCLQGVSTKSCRGINRFSHPPGGEAFPSARVSSLITKEGETHWKKKTQTLQTNTCTFGGDFNPFCYSNGSFCILQNPSVDPRVLLFSPTLNGASLCSCPLLIQLLLLKS